MFTAADAGRSSVEGKAPRLSFDARASESSDSTWVGRLLSGTAGRCPGFKIRFMARTEPLSLICTYFSVLFVTDDVTLRLLPRYDSVDTPAAAATRLAETAASGSVLTPATSRTDPSASGSVLTPATNRRELSTSGSVDAPEATARSDMSAAEEPAFASFPDFSTHCVSFPSGLWVSLFSTLLDVGGGGGGTLKSTTSEISPRDPVEGELPKSTTSEMRCSSFSGIVQPCSASHDLPSWLKAAVAACIDANQPVGFP
mmetsp:Transcript_2932/g.6041  ORF Transcript_2932/g.6041 Transcript_2932/m.6041 type:complete len:257 (+) Transcript_2932:1748-2518(+)